MACPHVGTKANAGYCVDCIVPQGREGDAKLWEIYKWGEARKTPLREALQWFGVFVTEAEEFNLLNRATNIQLAVWAGKPEPTGQGWNSGRVSTTAPSIQEYVEALKKLMESEGVERVYPGQPKNDDAGWMGPTQERLIDVSLCSAQPSCGSADIECSCRGKNCPGSKGCWKCGKAL